MMIGIRVVICALLTATPGFAATAPLFGELMRQAEATAPRVLESRANVGIAQGHADQAGALPNPTGDVFFENFGGHNNPIGGSNGLSPEQDTFSLSQLIELGGKRDARITAGSAELGAAQARDQRAVAEFGYDLALAYAGAEAARQRVRLLEEAVKAAKEDARGAQALVDAGREPGIRAKQASAASLGMQSDLEAARASGDQALARLSILAGSQQPFTDVIPVLLPSVNQMKASRIPPPKAFLSVTVAEAERRAALARLDLERARAIPDVTATLGVRRLVGDHQTVLVGGLSFPIPIFDQNSGNISSSGSEVAAADARLAAALSEAETSWAVAKAQALAVISRLNAAQSAAQAAEEAYGLTRTGYSSGKISLLDLLASRRALTDAQLRLLEAEVARIAAEASLARLSGNMPFMEKQ